MTNIRKRMLSNYKKSLKVFSGRGIGKIYPVKLLHWFILSHLRPTLVEVDGHKMFLDSRDSLNLSINGVWAPFETELIKKEVRKGDVLLDIGANIGYFTLIFARLVGQEGKVYAFEPEPTNFSLLKRNVEINGYKNVQLVQKAVSNKNGKIKLYLNEENMGQHKIYYAPDARKFIVVESIRLDDYFKDYKGAIDFIKIDIEGAEWAALQGMRDLLKKNRNVKILSEFSPLLLKTSGIEPKDYLKLLTDMGFKLYQISEERKEIVAYSIERENPAELLCVREN